MALLEHLPPESATAARLGGELPGRQWSRTDHLLATVVDVLQVGNWQRQGKKGAPRPAPVKRPGLTPNEEHFGGEAMAPEEVDAILAARYTHEEV